MNATDPKTSADLRRLTLRRDLKDGSCEICSARLSPADQKAGHSTCAQCRSRFPRKAEGGGDA
jgi:hypothetical protein